jgi:hypothetical protein
MAIPHQRVFNQVFAQLNANPTAYGGASEKPEYRDAEVWDVMQAVECEIFAGLGRAVKHGRRKNLTGLNLIFETVVTNGAEIPSHVGPILEVEIDGLFGTPLDVDMVRELAGRNVLNLKLTDGYWGTKDNFLYFTGTQAKVTYFNYTRPVFANLAAFLVGESKLEPEFESCWVDLVVGRVMPREGAFLQAASVYTQRGMMTLAGLLGEQIVK